MCSPRIGTLFHFSLLARIELARDILNDTPMVNKVKQLNEVLGFMVPLTTDVFPDIFIPHNAIQQRVTRVTGHPSGWLIRGVFVGLHELSHKCDSVGVIADCNFFHVFIV